MWSDRRRLVGALAVSLLINVFLGGVLVGRGYVLHHASPRVPPPGPLVPPRHVAALPDDQKTLFETAMIAHRAALRTARGAHKVAREKIEADIAAPVFDPAAVTADFEVLHRTNRDIDAATGAALVDALSGLSAASREALVAHGAMASGAPASGAATGQGGPRPNP